VGRSIHKETIFAHFKYVVSVALRSCECSERQVHVATEIEIGDGGAIRSLRFIK
jgi:hypothetical protein